MVLEMIYASRNIGDIFYTLRKDTTLNGAVMCDGAEYNASDFDLSDENNNPYALCISNKIPNVDYATYNSYVKSQGCCAYFGIDVVNGKFKVPTIQNVFIEACDASTLTQYLAPSFSGSAKGTIPRTGWGTSGGGFNQGASGTLMTASGAREISETLESIRLAGVNRSVSFNVSGSSVQPKAVKLRAMVQLVTAMAALPEEEEPEEPGVSLKIPYIFVPGTEAKATEVNTNFEYVLRAIESMDQTSASSVVHLDGDETIVGKKTFTTAITVPNIELMPSNTAMNGGYLDFHFAGSAADYTARIIEATRGYLSINQNPPANDATTKIATTAWVSNKVKNIENSSTTTGSASSWFKTSTGTYVEFGTTGQIGRGGSGIVTLPQAMPNAIRSVQITPLSWSGSTHGDKGSLTWVADSFTKSTFRILNRHEECAIAFSWVAYGY